MLSTCVQSENKTAKYTKYAKKTEMFSKIESPLKTTIFINKWFAFTLRFGFQTLQLTIYIVQDIINFISLWFKNIILCLLRYLPLAVVNNAKSDVDNLHVQSFSGEVECFLFRVA